MFGQLEEEKQRWHKPSFWITLLPWESQSITYSTYMQMCLIAPGIIRVLAIPLESGFNKKYKASVKKRNFHKQVFFRNTLAVSFSEDQDLDFNRKILHVEVFMCHNPWRGDLTKYFVKIEKAHNLIGGWENSRHLHIYEMDK